MRLLFLFLFLTLSLGEITIASTVDEVSPCTVVGAANRPSKNLLGALTQWPTPAFMILEKGGSTRFVAPSKVYADVLDLNEKSLIINDVEELRFLSQTLAKSDVLLILKDTGELNAEKAKKVLSVAKLLDIKLSLVWLSDRPSPKTLKDLVAYSGGRSYETRDLLKRTSDLCLETLAAH